MRRRSSGRRVAGVLAIVAWGSLLVPDSARSADPAPTVRCESQARETVRCKADTRNGVTLARQHSRAGCWYDETWGYDAKGIWVSNGCRADFALGRKASVGPTTSPSSNAAPSESSGLSGNQIAAGAAAALVVGAIAAAVIANRNGDDDDDDDRRCRRTDRRGRCVEWYDDDCRYRDSRGRCIDGANDPWGRDRRVKCESQGHKERYCRVDTRRGVELYRQLSEAKCRYGSSWGYDRKGIWVDRGCRGEFVIRG